MARSKKALNPRQESMAFLGVGRRANPYAAGASKSNVTAKGEGFGQDDCLVKLRVRVAAAVGEFSLVARTGLSTSLASTPALGGIRNSQYWTDYIDDRHLRCAIG
jgi:hypothetical protein